jgi:hypothetical protein
LGAAIMQAESVELVVVIEVDEGADGSLGNTRI